MPDERDMAVPVTRGEMDAALERWATDIVQTLQKVLGEYRHEYRRELRELREEFATGFRVLEQHLRGEIRVQVRQSEENVITRVEQMFDPYKRLPDRIADLERHDLPRRVDELDQAVLPDRVGKLEATVFAAPKRRAAARRKRS